MMKTSLMNPYIQAGTITQIDMDDNGEAQVINLVMPFCDMMRQVRESEGLTIYKLHKLSGISDGYLYKVERGEVVPSYDKCAAIMQAMGYKLDTVKIQQ